MLVQVAGLDVPTPFRRLTYEEALLRYGTDKPDLRYGLEMSDVTAIVQDSSFRVFAAAAAAGGVVMALRVPDGKRLSNARVKAKGDVAEQESQAGAGGLVYIRMAEGGALEAAKPVKEGLSPEAQQQLLQHCQAQEGDLLLLAAGPKAVVNRALDAVRQYVAGQLGEVPASKHALLWVTDFPLFEVNEEEGRLESMHHPCTAPDLKRRCRRCLPAAHPRQGLRHGLQQL